MTGGIQVDVRRSGKRFEAEAVLELAADPQTVWDTITDYAALPRFMPGIRACRVTGRETLADGSERVQVEQQGEFRFLLFAQTMRVWLDIEHQPLRLAHARATRCELGLLRQRAIEVFEGRYELVSAPPRRGRGARTADTSAAPAPTTTLRYTALIGLALPPPPAIGNVAVRQNLTGQLEALVAGIGRRR